MTNENDDWEVAVDTGEFDKRLEQQEKDRAAIQLDLFKESISSTVNDNDNRNLIKSNKPIRILKRPTSQSQLPVSNDINNSSQISTNTNSPFPNEISSSTTVPLISIIPRNQTKDSINPTIKTYEQREQEYRLARLRIMGEEESSAKDDDDNDEQPTIEFTPITSDETSRITFPSQSALPSQANYALNNPIGAIHFTPNTNTIGPFSQQHYHPVYSTPYPPMPLPRYPSAPLYNYPIQSSSNPWYQYQQEHTQQYGHPQ